MSARPATDVIRDIRFGELLDEFSDELNTVVTAVESTGKPGSITLTLKFKPSSSGAIEVTDDVKTKIPMLAKGSSLFFATPEGNLVRDNPRQKQLPGLKQVNDAPEQPLKEIKNG